MNTKHLNKGMRSIFIVCNETSTAPVWGYMIRVKKLRAVIQTDPQNAVQRCEEEEPALVILDLQLSHAKVLELYRKIRAVCENPIILFLPAYNENLILEYYEAGVDDCVVKPVSPVVFYAKVKAWLRHSKQSPVNVMPEIQVGNICLDPNRNLLIMDDGREIKLTNLEVRLLHLLMSRPDQVIEADAIINQVWGLYGEQDATLIKHVIYRLRQKIEHDPGNPHLIQTWHGKGYSFRSQ